MCLQSNTHKTFLLGSDELYFCPAAHVAPWGSLSWRRCRSWRPVRWTQGQLYSGTPAAAGTPSVLKSIMFFNIFYLCYRSVFSMDFCWFSFSPFVFMIFMFLFLLTMIYTRIISYHIHSSTLCTCADSVFNRYSYLFRGVVGIFFTNVLTIKRSPVQQHYELRPQ